MEHLNDFESALKRACAKAPFVRLDVGWMSLVGIVSMLQLALRHPSVTGAASTGTRKFLDEVLRNIEGVDKQLAEFLRMGDNPQHDQR
jgi:hypothetical protein